jgi:hypothetical protein
MFGRPNVIYNHNVKSLPKAKDMTYTFALVVENQSKMKEWLNDPLTMKAHINVKRRSIASALKEFRALNNVGEYFMSYRRQDENWKDDALEISYRYKVA